jgi:hypothetical protein
LETRFATIAEVQPERLAYHYTEAELGAQAVAYWQRAAERAMERSAALEAVNRFTTGIALFQALPETPALTQHAVTLHIALGAALLMRPTSRRFSGTCRPCMNMQRPPSRSRPRGGFHSGGTGE